ncbi:hypothetical protein FAF44_01925 [Nonomuraea sp. MG754425]|uniref:hypothetical protein n=1 Tax=Nonomuraea sp. MG754425 TaxID=2570319 RepID=UPI001F38E303|nr:hypothetical protein [Nonomuraea sp. MG754425]MCF6467172.1 hypothetical protein [Nonomuraea sp. MG754425]
MLPFSLGMAWLFLAPLCLWLLVRGSGRERAGAVVTLALLEAGTIAMSTVPHAALPARPAAAHSSPAPSARRAPKPLPATCAERAQVPRAAVAEGGRLLLSWSAAPNECDRAVVTLRARDHRLLIWLRTIRRTAEHATRRGARTLPVRVRAGTASMRVPLHGHARYVPADGRSGHRIPSPAT